MNHYWVIKAKQADGKWVNWAGVTAATKAEALEKARIDVQFPVRVVPGSAAQDHKFAQQECTSCGALLYKNDSFPWHGPEEDCRAVREPVSA